MFIGSNPQKHKGKPHPCRFHPYESTKPTSLLFLEAMERAAKLRRLEGLRRENPHISASALSSLVQDIQVNGLPDLHNRKHLKEARDFRIQEMNAYGPLFTEAPVMHKDGKERQLMFVNFFLCSLHSSSKEVLSPHWSRRLWKHAHVHQQNAGS